MQEGDFRRRPMLGREACGTTPRSGVSDLHALAYRSESGGLQMTMKLGQAAALALLLAASCSAHAQAYRCISGGTAYFSDRPCARAKPQISVYGPARTATATQYTPQLPGAPKAQEHVKYLGSACASTSEAIRTGPTRGVRGDVIRALHDEYSQKCSLEDQDARRQLQEEKSQQQQVTMAQRQGVRDERQQAKKRADQCTGMRDVVVLKRKRESELNAKEVGALRELEKAYNERCIAG